MTVDEFAKILAKGHQYTSLFHFTDTANIPSIAKLGILSKAEAARRGIKAVCPGGNEWSREADALKGLDDYVSLCFTGSHPMCHIAHDDGRIPNPQYIPIHENVLRIDGVKITMGIANKSETEPLDVEDGLERIDKEVLYTRTDWNDPIIQARRQEAEKCEILVPKVVAVKFFNRAL